MANNLGVSSYTVGGDFDTWGAKFIADMAILNKFAGDTFLTTSTGGVLALSAIDMQNFSIQANGGTSTQLDIRVLDGLSRFWYVRNDRSTGVVTVRCAAGGNAATLNPGERRLLYSDGVNIADLTLTTISIASVLGLQTALDAGRAYTDSIAANLGKRSRARVMDTTDSDPATSGYAAGATIDGVVLVAGDQVFRNSALHTARNGVWTAPASGAAVRADQFDTYDEHPGTLIAVQEGTAGADTIWLCTSNVGGTLNSTAILFSQMQFVPASTTVAGVARLATLAETITGTDATIAVTPAGLGNLGVARLGVAAQVVTGGARVTSNGLGTISSGTVTLDPGTRPLWDYTNGGAHTLAPGANTGSIILDITNNGSAGAITVSGWTKVVGSFDTTNAHKFRCSCSIGAAGSLLTIQPLF